MPLKQEERRRVGRMDAMIRNKVIQQQDRKIKFDAFVMMRHEEAVDENPASELKPLLKSHTNHMPRRKIVSETDVYMDGGGYVTSIKEEIAKGYHEGEAIPIHSREGVLKLLFNKIENLYPINHEGVEEYLEGTIWEMLYGTTCRYASIDWLEKTIESLSKAQAQHEGADIEGGCVLLVSRFFLLDEKIFNGNPKAGINGVNINVLNSDYESLKRFASDLSCMASIDSHIVGGLIRREAAKIHRQMLVEDIISPSGQVIEERLEKSGGEIGEYLYADIMDKFPHMLKRLLRLEKKNFIGGHYSEHFNEIYSDLSN